MKTTPPAAAADTPGRCELTIQYSDRCQAFSGLCVARPPLVSSNSAPRAECTLTSRTMHYTAAHHEMGFHLSVVPRDGGTQGATEQSISTASQWNEL
jgi:hypothetical protein